MDSMDEIDALAGLVQLRQNALLRVVLKVDPGTTHPAVTTGTSASKFGVSVEHFVGAVRAVLGHPSLRLAGLHCHLGSHRSPRATRTGWLPSGWSS